MSDERIKKFLAKPKKIKLGGEDIEIYPLKLKDIDLLIDMQDKDKQANALKGIMRETLKQSFPNASDDEINSFSMEYFNELTEAIMEVNGLNKKKELKV